MTDIQTEFIDIEELKIGMYIYLDVGWMDHPFPVSNFKLSTQSQIETIRSLGIERVRYAPAKSTLPATVEAPDLPQNSQLKINEVDQSARKRKSLLAEQQASLQLCERQFMQAAMVFKQVGEIVVAQPATARASAEELIQSFLNEVLGEEDAAIRLLSEKAGERSSLHSVNVTVISLLLGKALRLSKNEMFDLGVAALLHDIGKVELPDRLRWLDEQHNSAEKQSYYSHVMHSVQLGKKMQLSSNALLAMAQHHEYVDGSGYPNRITGEKFSPIGRIIALVNHYDNLCNPLNHAHAITPHEALSLIFTQHKQHFHTHTLTSFIRMMGIYPPGSVVQLTDERYAMVVSVNAGRPIKPNVIVHNPQVPSDEALILNLEDESQLGIQRSLKPIQLPKAAYDYLSPRKRLCYFFERGLEAPSGEVSI